MRLYNLTLSFHVFPTAETCKKRWKYLRERYVQQKKTGDSPSYEHLSRPYLEKMRFLDNFIQPRKSYRNVSHLLQSPNHSQHSLMDGGMPGGSDESSCIDRRLEQKLQISHIMQQFHNHMMPDSMAFNGGGGTMNGSADHSGLQMSGENMSFFEQYSNNFQSHHNQHSHQPHSSSQHSLPLPHQQHQQHHQQQQQQHLPTTGQSYRQTLNSDPSMLLASNSSSTTNSEAAVPNSDASLSQAPPGDGAIKNEIPPTTGSSSSSLVSSLASPINGSSQHLGENLDDSNRLSKRRKSSASIQAGSMNMNSSHKLPPATNSSNNNHILSDDDDDDDHNSPTNPSGRLRSPPFPADFLYPFYQHATSHAQHQRQQQHQQQMRQPSAAAVPLPHVRNSEQLLGELVTSELLKMTKERRKIAQKKILKVLFFDD